MNLLDVVIVVLAVSAAFGGYRLGFLTRVTSWIGMAGGVVLGAVLLPRVVRAVDGGADRRELLLLAAAVIIGFAFAGQAIGLVLGSRLHLRLPPGGVRRADAGVGSVAGVLGVLVTVWLLAPAMADVPDWPARETRGSRLVRTIDGVFPTPPDTTRVLRRLVGSRYPQVFDVLREAPALGPPPARSGLDAFTEARVARSTVKVLGDACGRIQEGTGFIVGPGLVVTNAHVVAGERRTGLERPDGSVVTATVVTFDPARDLAVLRAQSLGPPLPIGDIGHGGRGAVFGHPGGGRLRVAPFEVGERIDAFGMDIYDQHRVERDVLFLAAELHPGDSGSALVDRQGRVVGVAFAVAPDDPDVAYALSTKELRAALAAPRADGRDTGPCLK